MEKIIVFEQKEPYIAPDIEVVEIEMEQNILQSGSTGGDAPEHYRSDW